MITSYLAMQNAILSRNIATSRMMQTSAAMAPQVSFGVSQPLRPSFAQSNANELQMKADETKVSSYKNL